MKYWFKDNYRRVFLDMHIDDWHEDFLSKLDPEHLVEIFKNAGVNNLVIKAKPHTGLCYWPATLGRMHRGLKGMDYVGKMTELCRKAGITTCVYYSQVFDNWASDHHPDWRCINADGEDERTVTLRKGTCCPNNMEYRKYVRHNLQELAKNYDYDSMFLDMCFWWEVCYCPCCRKRYYEETGEEMPKVVDWADPKFIRFQLARDRWMAEFTKFATDSVKEIKPDVTIEHNFSTIQFPWTGAATEGILDACDFAGGDYYGGYLQQTFISKYYNNVTPQKPFEYITSRCDPDLGFQTCTKSYEEMLLHIMTALCHNGAFSLCDGINPDGTIDEYVYTDIMRRAFAISSQYEQYVSGDMISDVAVLFATNSKFNWSDNGKRVNFGMVDNSQFLTDPLKMTGILRDNNVPYTVVGSRNLKDLKDKVLILTNVVNLLDEEMEAIEAYVRRGGKLYVSGHLGHQRLQELLGVKALGLTEHKNTYMGPTELGKPYFDVFTEHSPLSVSRQMELVDLVEPEGAQVLAKVTLPYTTPSDPRFASIHSNPPGIHTDHPAIIRKQVGKGTILWLAASVECEPPYLTRVVAFNLVKMLYSDYSFYSNAPKEVEVVNWKKDGSIYFGVLNQQERPPVSPVHELWIDVPYEVKGATLLSDGSSLPVTWHEGMSRISLPRLDLFHMLRLDT